MMAFINGLILAMDSSLVALIVVKATIIVALALTGTCLARRSRAAVRHALLAAGFGMLLVLPIASVIAPPVRIAVLTVRQERTAPPPLAEAIDARSPISPTEAGAGAAPA